MKGSPLKPEYWTIPELSKAFELPEDTIKGYLFRKVLHAYKLHIDGSMRNFIDYNQLQLRINKTVIKQTNVSFEEWEVRNG